MTALPFGRRRRNMAFAAIGLAIAVAVAGCGSGGGSTSQSGTSSGPPPVTKGGTLLLGTEDLPSNSLDPALSGPQDFYNTNLSYEPLIRVDENGEPQPGLAESFEYVGSGNTQYKLVLRSGVTFSDGTPVTADAVAASIKYIIGSGTGPEAWLKGCEPTASGPLEVMMVCDTPNSDLTYLLSAASPAGLIISPAGVANPESLGTGTAGAGPYVIEKAVSGSEWTYIPNPNYWDKEAVHYDKVVVKYFAPGTAGLAALQSGQINVLLTSVGQTQKAGAGLSGVSVSSAEWAFNSTLLVDRRPSPSNPLADVKVRQALNYAVDKAAIAKVLWGDFGKATDQIASRNQPTAYDPDLDDTYPYDPEKAKQLLAEAGYPDGFSISFLTPGWASDLSQAEASYWEKVGVKAEITTDASAGFADNALGGNYGAITQGYGGLPMGIQAASFLEPNKSSYNPYELTDPAVLDLIAKAKVAPPSESVDAWHAVQAYGVHEAWFVSIGSFSKTQFVAEGTYGPPLQGAYFESFPTLFYPSS